MNLHEKYFHWIYGENKLRDDKPQYLINLEHGVSIRFDFEDAFFASFEEFYNAIADVQFVTGVRPDDDELESIYTEAWNFLCFEERKLEEDMEGFNFEDF